jgi:hypothetical protein
MIKIFTCPSGDWTVVHHNDAVLVEGHSISSWDFMHVLRTLGHEVEEVEISDEDMEEGNY